MNSMDQTTTQPRLGFAIAALVLGILSFVTSFMLVGAVFGLLGLILGALYLRRHASRPRGMAIGGLTLSALGIAASLVFGGLYYSSFKNFRESMAARAALGEWVGKPAPDFTVTTLDGATLTLGELRGRRVIVDFWATWCPPCVREVPHFNRLRQEVSPDDLIIVGISKEKASVIEPFVEEYGIAYPMVSTRDLPAPYSDVRAIPTTFFIDRNGVIQTVLRGYRDFDVLEEHALAGDYAKVVSSPEDARRP